MTIVLPCVNEDLFQWEELPYTIQDWITCDLGRPLPTIRRMNISIDWKIPPEYLPMNECDIWVQFLDGDVERHLPYKQKPGYLTIRGYNELCHPMFWLKRYILQEQVYEQNYSLNQSPACFAQSILCNLLARSDTDEVLQVFAHAMMASNSIIPSKDVPFGYPQKATPEGIMLLRLSCFSREWNVVEICTTAYRAYNAVHGTIFHSFSPQKLFIELQNRQVKQQLAFKYTFTISGTTATVTFSSDILQSYVDGIMKPISIPAVGKIEIR